MVHDDFSGDISSDEFISEDEHHEHEPKIEYIENKVIAYKMRYTLRSVPKVHLKIG